MNPAPALTTEAVGIRLLNAFRLLRSAGGALPVQAHLHGQLVAIEWEEEKNRLLKMLLIGLFGVVCLLCAMLFAGGLVLAATWDTAYRFQAFVCLILLYGYGMASAWRRYRVWSALGSRAFSASREELIADAAFLKARL